MYKKIQRQPRSTLFPYTTLFRSRDVRFPGRPAARNPNPVASIRLVASTERVRALRSILNVAVAVVARCVRTALLVKVVMSARIRLPAANSAPVISNVPDRLRVLSSFARVPRRTRILLRVSVDVDAPRIGVEREGAAKLLLSAISSPVSLDGPCKKTVPAPALVAFGPATPDADTLAKLNPVAF